MFMERSFTLVLGRVFGIGKKFALLFVFMSLTLGCLVLVSCSKSEDPPLPYENRPSRSVLVYMSADNSLSANVQSDVEEMLAGARLMGVNDRFVVFVDNGRNSAIYEIKYDETVTRFHEMKPVYQFDTNLNSANIETFDQIVHYFFDHYKAESYGLVLWSHAFGWISSGFVPSGAKARNVVPRKKTFGVDVNTFPRSYMNIPDMAEVLGRYPKFKFILFDACFMQEMEVAYEMRNLTDYIIGSPAEILADGAPYDKIVPSMFAEPFNPSSLVVSYANPYDQRAQGVILSAIKTDEFDGFVSVMHDLFQKYTFLTPGLYDDCLNYYLYRWNYSGKVSFSSPDMYDIKGIMRKVVTETADYEKWLAAYERLVPSVHVYTSWYSVYEDGLLPVDQAQCGGVSMYLPLEKYSRDHFFDYYKQTQWGNLFEILN